MDENIPFRSGVPEEIKTEITRAENRLFVALKAMYTCPECGHEQNGANDL